MFVPSRPPRAKAYPLSFDPKLVEETVLLAERTLGGEERGLYRSRLDSLYARCDDPDMRESRFRKFHLEWFQRLELGERILVLLEEHPALSPFSTSPSITRCAVVRAAGSRDEGADLHRDREEPPGAPPALVIRLGAETLLQAEPLAALLRGELLHVADMLDPEFGYRLEVPEVTGGPMRERLVRERYRVVWDTSVAGRLAVAGHLSASAERARCEEFLSAFAMLGPRARIELDRIFRGPRPTHTQMWAMAATLGGMELCPLCRFQHHSARTTIEALEPRLIAAIRAEFPEWVPTDGLCIQCSELYASRATTSS